MKPLGIIPLATLSLSLGLLSSGCKQDKESPPDPIAQPQVGAKLTPEQIEKIRQERMPPSMRGGGMPAGR